MDGFPKSGDCRVVHWAQETLVGRSEAQRENLRGRVVNGREDLAHEEGSPG
jgi:hypothetical protein